MTDPAKDAASVIELLTRYSFDLSGYTVDRLVEYWLQRYPSNWVRLAVVEALYQGRYKVVSVEQILGLWRRRGKPVFHFNPDFERIVTPRFVRGVPIVAEMVVISPEAVLDVVPEAVPGVVPESVPESVIEMELPMEKPPQPPRPAGAIQPFSVANSPLPREAMFRELGILTPEPPLVQLPTQPPTQLPTQLPEVNPSEPAEPVEPVYFPEPLSVEFKPIPDPATGEPPIQTFQPLGEQSLVEVFEAEGLTKGFGQQPIHQFVPMLEPSEFYGKLKAVIQNAAAAKLAKGLDTQGRNLGEARDSGEPSEP
jgi:hypothetical protein